MTFADVWKFTVWKIADRIPGSFTELSASKLYEYACQVPMGGVIVEVGVDQGRSASILLHAAERVCASVVLIDSWESVLIGNMQKVDKLRNLFPKVQSAIVNERSVDAAARFMGPIDLIHIDANHYEGGIDLDCPAWLSKVKRGGIACFHDYHESWPIVIRSVNLYTAGWEDLGVWDGLAIRRKP